ncbi:hypothetical protein ABES80_19185 [Bacillus gobiensis]|uniref:hypothetical protein n=1 Tax=Bacillus gobiensis TaxID=1441095 RepID=UPI003D237D06
MASKLAVPEKTGNVISIIMTGYSSSLVLGVPLVVLMTNWMIGGGFFCCWLLSLY